MSTVKRIEAARARGRLGMDPMQMTKGVGDHKERGLREARNLRFEGAGLPA
jgi:hypothetical protein